MIHVGSHSLSRPFEGPASRPRLMIWLHKLSPALFGLFIALTGIAGLVLNFGSLASATAFLAVHGVVIEEAEKDLGMVPLDDQREAHFRLQNLSRREITILGAKSPCTCTQIMALPAKIPAGETFDFHILYRAEKSGKFIEDLKIYTDDPVDSSLTVRLVVTVAPMKSISSKKTGIAGPPESRIQNH